MKKKIYNKKRVREVNGNTSKLSKIHFPIVWRQVFNGFPSPNAHCFEFKLLFLCCQPAALISIVLSSCEFLELCSLHFLTHTSLRDCFFFFSHKKNFSSCGPGGRASIPPEFVCLLFTTFTFLPHLASLSTLSLSISPNKDLSC